MTGFVIGLILAAMLVQYTLAWRQARRFAAQVEQLRHEGGGTVTIGVGRRRGRRVYVALNARAGVVESALVMSGSTVFASGAPYPALVGRHVAALAEGAADLSPIVSQGAAQAAEFVINKDRRAALAD